MSRVWIIEWLASGGKLRKDDANWFPVSGESFDNYRKAHTRKREMIEQHKVEFRVREYVRRPV